ncbi:hypothetical protein [Pseudomonas lundensis]|uniref:Phage protein n=1 Tax=Pseudomonas lundensis TaxID=86185 RepID=A0ABX4GHP5_9PSED|nr:hypothetical protein [Pseudomonas lundensis]NMZ54177.1 hypothetical protein [Pseudomonas lundensis]OZY53632.1 hypothetical protein CJF38_18975 [Pseudomonas lundensis]
MQNNDYAQAMSGFSLNLKTGEFELNTTKLQVGALPSNPQQITITAGEWPDNELPSNAIDRYAFIGAELEKIPAEFRESAQFTTEDFSFDRDGSDYRTTLTYARQETQDEAKARHEKAKAAGTRISLVGGALCILHDGVPRIQISGVRRDEKPAPFIIVDGVMYINGACIKEASLTGNLSVRSLISAKVINGYTGPTA